MIDLLFELDLTEKAEKTFFDYDFRLVAALHHCNDFFKIWQLPKKVFLTLFSN